ncbi:hypothetical protein HZI73_16170 [Vallitalea pronyensis]|uniref:Uncharacterized protein n=1 Tax=Vallitalea pronyensis TaxID=1348613 RepID=A0A8J8MLY2_9FIRM|nr:hypothetical protein [Vallitalea pronyensis]QUI23733.1 hypothetical protein HZI73_16170 [Vallitalea pronyensis]
MMFNTLKANIYYTLQNKFYLAFQLLGFVYVAIVSFLFAPKYCSASDLRGFQEMPLGIFLFVMTFMFISTPLLKSKSNQLPFSHFMLSFPVKKCQLVTSHFLKILLLKGLIFLDIVLFSWIALSIKGISFTMDYILLIGMFIIYAIGVTGSLYILMFFMSKWFDVLVYVLYFGIFFALTLPMKFNALALSEYRHYLLMGGFLFMLVTYFISLVMSSYKEF